jgi:hypothetical protein
VRAFSRLHDPVRPYSASELCLSICTGSRSRPVVPVVLYQVVRNVTFLCAPSILPSLRAAPPDYRGRGRDE